MFIILIYDANAKRTSKILRCCRQYLNHVQNSVFEGKITKSNFQELKSKIKKIIKDKEDSIIIYRLYLDKYAKKEIIGIEKRKCDNFV